MSDARIELSYSGIGQILRGPEMASLMASIGAAKAAESGEGYTYRVHDTGQRQAVNIYATSRKARKDNLQNNTLLKVGNRKV